MPQNFKIIIIIGCIIMPILGYSYMKIVLKNVKIFMKTKIINRGIYKNNPVYGDKVIPIANSFKRVGIIFFVFTILFSALCALILYIRW
ncbi:hypothetical protein JN12_03819 [Geobacter argillaceus]|uniref:Uncharacterized protein n=1 Tax=Geobacter argillaceus TaxID=345631 RepID=A0A562V6H6_9BACT|nr:hypothetical protein JN12_03819 [Geobacter argillaceus]